MAKYLTDVEFREQVRVCLDQNMTSDALSLLEDVDTLSLDELIDSKVEDAALSVINAAPIYKLGDVSKPLDGDISISANRPYKVSVPLPTDFARLVRFNMEGWRYPIFEALPPFTPLYDQANSGFNTFGTKDRPAAFLVPTADGKKLEVFSASTTADDLDDCRYAAKPKKKRVYVANITINVDTISLYEGATIALSASIYPSNATNKRVTWETSDESVATVSENGVVTAVSEGSCLITCSATDGSGVEAYCDCAVVAEPTIPVTNITLSDEYAFLSFGQTKTLTATIEPQDATNPDVIWTKSGEGIDISSDGLECEIETVVGRTRNKVYCSATDGSGVIAACVVDVGQSQSSLPTSPFDSPISEEEPLPSTGADEGGKEWSILLAEDLIRPTIYYTAYLTALAIKDDNAAEKLLGLAKAMIEE